MIIEPNEFFSHFVTCLIDGINEFNSIKKEVDALSEDDDLGDRLDHLQEAAWKIESAICDIVKDKIRPGKMVDCDD